VDHYNGSAVPTQSWRAMTRSWWTRPWPKIISGGVMIPGSGMRRLHRVRPFGIEYAVVIVQQADREYRPVSMTRCLVYKDPKWVRRRRR
jgi:hypothetical protein